MRNQGVRFQPSYGRQAFEVDGKFKFWGGLAIETWGGGVGLMGSLFERAEELGVRIVYEARATELRINNGRIEGVLVNFKGNAVIEVVAKSVVLASGGFEANAEIWGKFAVIEGLCSKWWNLKPLLEFVAITGILSNCWNFEAIDPAPAPKDPAYL